MTKKNRKQLKKTLRRFHKGVESTNNGNKNGNNTVTKKPTVEVGTNYASKLNALESAWEHEQRNLESANRKGYNTLVREHKVKQEEIAEEHERLNAERRKLRDERRKPMPKINTHSYGLIERYGNYIYRGRRPSMFDIDENE